MFGPVRMAADFASLNPKLAAIPGASLSPIITDYDDL